jgi:hypothetical protein
MARSQTRFLETLHDITHVRIPCDALTVINDIRTALKKRGITPRFHETPTFEDKWETYKYGLAFGISVWDDGFNEIFPDKSFRYRVKEVRQDLRGIVTGHELAPIIRWGRGMGVFVSNLYFQVPNDKRRTRERSRPHPRTRRVASL